MTATHVNGVTVVADEPAPSPISRPGVTVTFEQIRHLLLADGAEVYGCRHCTYTSPNINSIRPHLKAHKPKKPKAAVAKAPKSPAGAVTAPPNRPKLAARRKAPQGPAKDAKVLASLSLGELVERAQLTEQMRTQRDQARSAAEQARRRADDWKERADDYRARFEGMKGRAEEAERRLGQVRALVQ
ncbi:hypothetical protein ACIG3E_33690 [Streptomyces sp. NPDC053474]|uniref:hypothetical protein n=1 Tax=Streptomyces sp. NPDC053474 TaxID=3365704 RepID=UPI0037D7CA2A